MQILKYPITGIKTIINFLISFIKHFFIGIIATLVCIPKYLTLGIKCLFNEKLQKELKMEDKIIPIIITTLSITTYLLSIFLLTRWYVQNERSKRFANSLNESTELIKQIEKDIKNPYTPNQKTSYSNENYPDDLTFLNVDLNPYIRKNSETVAWIQVNGTNISYPVVQHSDNNYYLNHDFNKRKSITGWVFADYRDNFEKFNNNTIFYAHNTLSQTMFSQLTRTTTSSWRSNPNYHYIKLSTKKNNSIWQIFSTYKTAPTTNYLQSLFNSTEVYKDFLTFIKSKSNYNFNTDITEQDKIITLSTCDNTGKKRIVVHAKLINIENKT